MAAVCYWIRRVAELLIYPFDQLPPTWSLVAIAAVTSVLMVVVVGKVTPQARIRRARDAMAGSIYEIRLFLDSPRRVLVAQGRLLANAAVYTVCLLPAFAVLTPPLGLLYAHLEARHGLTGLPPNSQTVVEVDIDDDYDGYQIEPGPLPAGLDVTAPLLVDEGAGAVYLRVAVGDAGTYQLPIRAGDRLVDKRLVVGGGAVTPQRSRGVDLLWALGLERPIDPEAPIRAIRVDYPAVEQSWLGLPMPWWLFWLLLATVGALAVKRPLGVEL